MSPTPEQIEAAAAAIWNYGDPFLSWGEVCGESFADETREKARAALEAAASVPPPDETPPLKELCSLFMASDPTPVPADEDAAIEQWLNAESRRQGFDGWIEAFHRLGPSPSSKEPTE